MISDKVVIINDHDLLVRIDEKVQAMRVSLDNSLQRIAVSEKNISSLQMSRAALCAVTAFIVSASALLIKIFWPK